MVAPTMIAGVQNAFSWAVWEHRHHGHEPVGEVPARISALDMTPGNGHMRADHALGEGVVPDVYR